MHACLHALIADSNLMARPFWHRHTRQSSSRSVIAKSEMESQAAEAGDKPRVALLGVGLMGVPPQASSQLCSLLQASLAVARRTLTMSRAEVY